MLTQRANIQCKRNKNSHESLALRALETRLHGKSWIFFLAALGLHCCEWAFSCCRGGGYSLVAMGGLLLLWSTCSKQASFSGCGAWA